jgi:hypothetical protein
MLKNKIGNVFWIFEAKEDNNKIIIKVKDNLGSINNMHFYGEFQKESLKKIFEENENKEIKDIVSFINNKIKEKDYFAFKNDINLQLIIANKELPSSLFLKTEMLDFNKKNNNKDIKKEEKKWEFKLILFFPIIILVSWIVYILCY